MLKTRLPVDKPAELPFEAFEIPGPFRRNGPALQVKIDSARVVERRTTEIKRLQRQFSGIVARPSRFQGEDLTLWLSTSYVPVQQRWGPRLERDIQAICAEAGLSPAATNSILAAASRGTIAQNPGVLLSRILTFSDCFTEPLGRRGVLAVLRAAPSLLRYSPESLRWNCDMLAALLPDGTLASVVRRAPMLLPASAMTLWGNFEGLRHLLRLNHDSALRLVVRAPRLLLNTRGALEVRLQDLALLAGESSFRRVATVVLRQPSLLGYFPGTLERNLRHVAGLLGVPFQRVQSLLLRQPTLLMLSQQAVTQRVGALRAALRLEDPADLAAVVLRQPSVLTLAPEAMQQKAAVVERVLGLEGRPAPELAVVLRAVPQVLTLASESIEAKAAALRAAVAPSAELVEQLGQASAITMALWLCMSSRRYDHVRAVVEGATQSTVTVPGAPGGCEGGSGSRSGSCGTQLLASESSAGKGKKVLEAGAAAYTMPASAAGLSEQHGQPGNAGDLGCTEAVVIKRPRGRPKKQKPQPPPGSAPASLSEQQDLSHVQQLQLGRSVAVVAAAVHLVVAEGEGPESGEQQRGEPGEVQASGLLVLSAVENPSPMAAAGASCRPVRQQRGRPRKVRVLEAAVQSQGAVLADGDAGGGDESEPRTRGRRRDGTASSDPVHGAVEAAAAGLAVAPRLPSLSMLLRGAPVSSQGSGGRGKASGGAGKKRGAGGGRAGAVATAGKIPVRGRAV